VHDVAVRNFMSRGVSLADVARWSIEHSTIEDIGCMQDRTPCSRLTVPDPFPSAPGYTSTGFGLHVDWYSEDVTIRANQIRRVTKYSLGFKHGQDGSQPSIRRPRVIGNVIEQTGQVGIFLGGVADALFEDNRIAATDSMNRRPEGRSSDDTFGVTCNGAGERIAFRRNRIEDMAGMAISWGCAGRANLIEQTHIARSCRQKNPESCTPGHRTCYFQPDVLVASNATGELALVENEIEDSKCASPLAAYPAARGFDLLVRGGRYAGGGASSSPVHFQASDVIVERGASFSETGLEFGPGTRGVVAPSVSVTGKGRAFKVDHGSQVLVCPTHPADCLELCTVEKPPPWCDKSGAREVSSGAVETRAAKVAFASGLSTFLSVALQLLSVPVCLRYWGNETYGLWLALFSLFNVLRTLDGGYSAYVGNELNLLYHRDPDALAQDTGVRDRGRERARRRAARRDDRDRGQRAAARPARRRSGSRARSARWARARRDGRRWALTGPYLGIVHRLQVPAGLLHQATWWLMGFQIAQAAALVCAAVLRLEISGAAVLMSAAQVGVYLATAVYVARKLPRFFPWWRGPSWSHGLRDLYRSTALVGANVLIQVGTSGVVMLISSG
jgi:hypothetical protein